MLNRGALLRVCVRVPVADDKRWPGEGSLTARSHVSTSDISARLFVDGSPATPRAPQRPQSASTGMLRVGVVGDVCA